MNNIEYTFPSDFEAIYAAHLAAKARTAAILEALGWPAYEAASEYGYPVREGAAAELRIKAQSQQELASAYLRQAEHPIYNDQSTICMDKAARAPRRIS